MTVYTGNDGHTTWDAYIRVRQNAHLELALLEAPVDKKRMVALMLDGVKAHGLEPLIGAIRDNRVLLTDFDAVQKLLKLPPARIPSWEPRSVVIPAAAVVTANASVAATLMAGARR
jgi:hypothetical protein